MPYFQFVDIFLFLGAGHAVFLAIALWRIPKDDAKANRILAVILLLVAAMLAGRVIYIRFSVPWIVRWSLFLDVVIFLFGPLCYAYFKQLTNTSSSSKWRSFGHYIPALMHLAFFAVLYIGFSQKEYFQLLSGGQLSIPFIIIEGSAIFLNLLYWILSLQLIINYRKKSREQLSFKQPQISYIYFLQVSILLSILLWLSTFTYYNLFGVFILDISYDTVWIIMPVLIYLIGYFAIKQPQIFRISEIKNDHKEKKRLSPYQLQSLVTNLNSLIEKDKIYLKADLTLQHLAHLTSTSTHDLSWFLNHEYKTNFYDYINQHRVQEFISKLEKKEHKKYTLLALSHAVGFNSKSTFNKAFKIITNETPSGYIKKLDMQY
ncbi:MAG: helix-turn-helix domain-containing protein [Cyclobacteriaceae bacterium]